MIQRSDAVEEPEDKKGQPGTSASSINTLKDAAWKIIKGDFDSSSKLYEIAASDSETDEMRDLAETMGMLSVKIEAREFSLEQKIEEIKSKNEQLEQAAKLQSMSGFLLSTTVILLSFYAILVSQILKTDWINSQIQTAITYGFVAGTGFVIFLYLRKYRFPLSYWGLTLNGSKRALIESILISIPVAAFVIGLKIYLINTPGNSFSGQDIFITTTTGVNLFLYLINSFVQEFICRGFVQNNAERMLTGKYKSFIAILTTSMLFGVVHMHLSGTTIFVTIFAGIFFGLLYLRNKTLVGVTVSHFILGELLFELGFIG
ncbi:MAG: hypothetical protein A2W90_12850 [Bacteroidetes bacterium GWF2_42_66]|nr:MAG: hypothetical protein A2W92_22580 [Bacteroidetes bacterium GWA2_42_15]OFY00110.1 MAG: hypothetical protein A2W89_17835 [Bacteroidetes bacterium GWE2_42_39]OFY40253.1 MAG: hypothetical protein A2W90_12850 [Bacteroidetes bacterium GWF2_42_66]